MLVSPERTYAASAGFWQRPAFRADLRPPDD